MFAESGRREKATKALLVVATFSLVAFYFVRAVALDMPIFASDEYAYFIQAKFRGVDLFALDPMLQRISNQLTFAWFNKLLALGHFERPPIIRIVHLFELIGVGAILYFAFAEVLSRRARAMAALATLMLPSSVYALAAMPETELTLLSAIVGFLMIRGMDKRPIASSCAIGVVAGLALLIKPHGLAWAPAVLAALGALAALARKDAQRVRRLVIAMPCFLAAWYATFVIGWRLSGAPLSFNPADALGLQFYGGALKPSQTDRLKLMIGLVEYSAAHLAVLLALFLPATIAFWRAFAKAWLARGRAETGGMTSIALYLAALIGAHLAMIAYFSVSAGANNAFEAYRVFGRYFGCILIFMPFMVFKGLQQLDSRRARLAALATLAAYALLYAIVIGNFKIFPWDYPELFAFFTAPNAYQWTFRAAPIVTGTVLLAGLALASVVAALRPSAYASITVAALFATLLVGQAQTHQWLIAHMRLNREAMTTAQGFSAIVAPSAPGDGVFVGDARFGQMSYALFKLANAPRVLVRPAGGVITQADVEGAKWVILSRPHQAEFAYRSAVRVDESTLYLLDATHPVVSMRAPAEWKGDPIKIALAKPEAGVRLSGFNETEAWGAIAAQPDSAIELPVALSGKVRITLFGWMQPQANKTLRVSVGDAEAHAEMTEQGADYKLDLDIKQPSNFVKFRAEIVHPESSHRNLGVALARVRIERLPD